MQASAANAGSVMFNLLCEELEGSDDVLFAGTVALTDAEGTLWDAVRLRVGDNLVDEEPSELVRLVAKVNSVGTAAAETDAERFADVVEPS